MSNENYFKQQIQELVQNQFQNETTGHDWFHIERVLNMACYLQKSEGGDLEIIALAALLHDISDHKFNGGSLTKGGETAYNHLIALNYPKERAERVKDVIDQVSFKGALVTDETSSLEAKIVQDADRLDAMGAIGIARTFAYGGHTQQPLYDPAIEPKLHTSFEAYKNSKSHSINHFYEKLLLLNSKLHTETAKKIGNQRHQILQNFMNDFLHEWNFN